MNLSKSFTYWKYDYNGLEIPQGVDIITFWTPNVLGIKEYALNALKNKYCFFVDDMIIGNYLQENYIQIEQLERKWKWPWIPSKSDVSLLSQNGTYSRDNSNKECYNFLN